MTTPSEDAIDAEVGRAALALESLGPEAFCASPEAGPRSLDWELLNFARWAIECRWRAAIEAATPQQIAEADRKLADFGAQLISLGVPINDPAFLYAMQFTGSVLSHVQAKNVESCVNYTSETGPLVAHFYTHVTDGLNELYYWLRSRFIALGVPAPHEPAPGEQAPRGSSPGAQ